MPRTVYPPTPGSSTDIKGQDGTKQLAALQMSFELPEPALAAHDPSQQRTPTDETPHTKSAYLQPSETVKSRRRPSAVQPPKDQFALPPPPMRRSKIIQMKPRPQEETDARTASTSKAAASSAAAHAGGNKKKQPPASSAAGRKIARKTAHSLIERRRRSKMNDEFALLKSMIPACSGEMHKLAILQASIEYVRYLEDCVAKLKAQRDTENPEINHNEPHSSFRFTDKSFQAQDEEDEEEDTSDVEMEGSSTPSPRFTAVNSGPHAQSVSPVLLAQATQHRHHSDSSASTDYHHYAHTPSASTSPSFGPQAYHYAHSASGSALTSPALAPQRDVDQEATAALMMLNQSDRRGTGGRQMAYEGRGDEGGEKAHMQGQRRSMSVKDLLSS